MKYDFHTAPEFIAALERMIAVVEEAKARDLNALIAAIRSKGYPAAWHVRSMPWSAWSFVGW